MLSSRDGKVISKKQKIDMENLTVCRVWTDMNRIYAETEEGITGSYMFCDWPRLASATSEQREDFHLSYYGIHWPQLDEDLSFGGMFGMHEDDVRYKSC